MDEIDHNEMIAHKWMKCTHINENFLCMEFPIHMNE
jgi:hypothetical protein